MSQIFGQQHPLADRHGSTKVLWSFSIKQVGVLLFGAWLSHQFSQIVPKLPFDHIIFAHMHHLLPLGIIALLLFTKEPKTKLNMTVYLYHRFKFKLRKKEFRWQKN